MRPQKAIWKASLSLVFFQEKPGISPERSAPSSVSNTRSSEPLSKPAIRSARADSAPRLSGNPA